jgi:hypothetical protein
MYSSEGLNAARALELRIRILSREIFVFILQCCLTFSRDGRYLWRPELQLNEDDLGLP